MDPLPPIPAGLGQPPPGSNAAPNNQTPGHPSFRRQRASRACETCHARKVRCDAASLGVPCTNCVAFSIECKIPIPKRKKAGHVKTREVQDSERGESIDRRPSNIESPINHVPSPSVYQTPITETSFQDVEYDKQQADDSHYIQFMKPRFTRAPIKDAGRVAYLGESSNLTLLVNDRHGTADVVHYPLPENMRGARGRPTDLDQVEMDILNQRGAFLLPPRALCDELVDAYFAWVAPIMPIINKTRFLKRYRDEDNPPSLLLLQAILLAGSRVCNSPQLMDANGSSTPAALTFYKRAKALYDANYEDDRVTIVQALVLMAWFWESPEDVTKNVFYWSRVAMIVAQGSGMHRSVEKSQLGKADKRLWKRIWWTLFTRDRSVAVALGRPVHINTDDTDVEMISEDDFIEDEEDEVSEHLPNATHVQFFLQYVKLCEIMGLVLSQQYSVAAKGRRQNAMDLTHSDAALGDWLHNCPKEMHWDASEHKFWSALLQSNFCTTLCLLHRAHMPPATLRPVLGEGVYPSRIIAFQAAAMITSIVENLSAHGELRFCPAFIVYSLFSALIMHIYQMRSSSQDDVQNAQERIQICMAALKEISRVWLVARMVYTLFESILANKNLEERLHKAAGKRHKKMTQALSQGLSAIKNEVPAKRKYEDMALDFAVSTAPAHQESYERSRPQTPSRTTSGDMGQPAIGQTAPMAAPPPPQQAQPISPQARNAPQDAFMGGSVSRPQTRPQTPFNPSYSVPATPPDLYLVTRTSPNLSSSVWENFQPDQLFPEGSAAFAQQAAFSPAQPSAQMQTSANPNLDPSLMAVAAAAQSNGMRDQQQQQAHHQNGVSVASNSNAGGATTQTMNTGSASAANAWQGQAGFDPQMHDTTGSSPSDSWSSSSAPAVPTTLNVEDWFQFFGLNGDMGTMDMNLAS